MIEIIAIVLALVILGIVIIYENRITNLEHKIIYLKHGFINEEEFLKHIKQIIERIKAL